LALSHLGVPESELDAAAAKVSLAVSNALEDERGQWILAAHTDARSEYALTGVLDGKVRSVVLDRSFVDETGVRWIVDFKTTPHGDADVEAFLDQQRLRHVKQLEDYACLLGQREARPIRLGLYFPLLRGWREWAY